MTFYSCLQFQLSSIHLHLLLILSTLTYRYYSVSETTLGKPKFVFRNYYSVRPQTLSNFDTQRITWDKNITKLPINLALIYLTTFRCKPSSKSEWQFVKKHLKLPRVKYLLEIKCLGTILSPKCDGGQTVWPYYDLDSTGTASCALPVCTGVLGVVAPGSGSG